MLSGLHNCRFSLNYARMAECRGLAPLARRHALVSTEAPGPLVRLTFQKWCPWPDSHRHWRRFELRASALGYTGGRAHGRICTDTVRVLSALPLRWATWANWCRVKDLHLQPPRSERGASSFGLTRPETGTPGKNLTCNLRVRSAAL